MSVYLRPMTLEEFIPYEDADAHRYAENMVRAGFWSSKGAFARAKQAHARLLPDGIYTKDHLFFVIEDSSSEKPIGVIWLFIDRETNPPSGFVYDLFVDDSFRGRGFGKLAMCALEKQAKGLGLSSLALNVFEANSVAKALYTSLGYQIQSLSMRKLLSPDEEDVS